MGRVVLVTGVSHDFGGRFARLLADTPGIDRVIGVDVVPPRGDLGQVSFTRADIRNPVIAKVIAGQDVDTVVHMSVRSSTGRLRSITVALSAARFCACSFERRSRRLFFWTEEVFAMRLCPPEPGRA